ncbi:MAG TPA: hypothetical protein VG317_11680 [Pseudonocardiaceae bacterium]|jgi:hypothetical protein|nr:hypothetical protein [Pseudonocardiaceae bacterium]
MNEPITVNYVPDGDDWRITAVAGAVTKTATATGLMAARDQVDQLVAKMAPGQESPTVVHLLNGDAVAFTTQYLHARLGLDAPATERAPAAPASQPAVDTVDRPATAPAKAAADQPDPASANQVTDAITEDKPAKDAQGAAPEDKSGDGADPADVADRDDPDQADQAEAGPAHSRVEPAASTGHLMAADSVGAVIAKRGKAAGEPDDGEANQLTQVINAVQ